MVMGLKGFTIVKIQITMKTEKAYNAIKEALLNKDNFVEIEL